MASLAHPETGDNGQLFSVDNYTLKYPYCQARKRLPIGYSTKVSVVLSLRGARFLTLFGTGSAISCGQVRRLLRSPSASLRASSSVARNDRQCVPFTDSSGIYPSRWCDLTGDAYHGIIIVRKSLAVKNKALKLLPLLQCRRYRHPKAISAESMCYKETVLWPILRPEWMN